MMNFKLWRAALFPPFMLAAVLLGFAFVPLSQESSDPNAQAKQRLSWMREHQRGMWNVAPREGLFLHDLVVQVRAKHALEIGTSNGYSRIWIAAGLRQTSGHLLTLEIDPRRANLAQGNFRAAGGAGGADMHAHCMSAISRRDCSLVKFQLLPLAGCLANSQGRKCRSKMSFS
jgi:hypothetical protein